MSGLDDYETTCDAIVPGDPETATDGHPAEDRCYAPATGYSDQGDGYLGHLYPWPACREHATLDSDEA